MRAQFLRQAIEQCPDLALLEEYYALGSVTLPYGLSDIEASVGERRKMMQDVRNQIDLGVTAEGECTEGETLQRTAMRVLAEQCRIRVSESIWGEVQYRMRKLMEVDVGVEYWDRDMAKCFVLILPSDLRVSTE